MSFGASETYIYAYIAFASVYLVASLAFVASALRVSTNLSRVRQTVASVGSSHPAAATNIIGHGQRVVDYTQVSTLLPLVYIVVSMFLGSVITHNVSLARTVNIGWIAFTVLCAVASVLLSGLGIHESRAISHTRGLPEESAGAPDALQRIGMRLGVSAALLLLVAVFTLLNLWSIVSSLGILSKIDFLL